ncbi:MAG: pseudouridine synthase [Succinivibrio sp.]|jgi:tRNA pseudouridine32 synthase/23S rRNA pseudouridine746 synthase|nr:pseudouridine synthase [Succinivibrio sp.]
MDDFVYSPPQKPFLDVVYEDEGFMVLVKPSGLLSVPGRGADHQDSLLMRVRKSWPQAQAVHRLDLDTSGLMAVALNREAAGALGAQFQKREVQKLYLARIAGCPKEDSGEIRIKLRCDWERRPLQIADPLLGKEAHTSWHLLRRGNDSSLVALVPHTGRSHQLRVHLALCGHPILGDRFYAPREVQAAAPRLLLHAGVLALRHPKNGRELRFLSIPPFEAALDCAALEEALSFFRPAPAL